MDVETDNSVEAGATASASTPAQCENREENEPELDFHPSSYVATCMSPVRDTSSSPVDCLELEYEPENGILSETENGEKPQGNPALLEHIFSGMCGDEDTVITCEDGKIKAHRLVLAAASPFLYELLLEQGAKRTATIVIPDVKIRIMEKLLGLAYKGKTHYKAEDEDAVLSAMKLLFFCASGDLSKTVARKKEKPRTSTSTQQPEKEVVAPVPGPGTSYGAQPELPNGSRMASFEEMQILTHCSVRSCNAQWKTLERSKNHLNTHGYARCWICLEAVKKNELGSHYYIHRVNPESLISSYSVRCRWCPRILNLGRGSACVTSHSMTHLPSAPSAKKRGRLTPATEEFNFKIPTGPAPRKRPNPPSFNNRSTVLGNICGPPTHYYIDELTGKCRIDLSKLPMISIPIAPVSSKPLVKYSEFASHEQHPDGSYFDGAGNLLDFPEHFLYSADSTQGMNRYEDTLISVQPVLKESDVVPTLSLLTQDWGQVQVSVHEGSRSPVTNFTSDNGILLIGRVSPDFIWKKIDEVKSTKDVRILRLAPRSPSDAQSYSLMYSYLSSDNRLGIVSGAAQPNVVDSVYLFAADKEDYARKGLPMKGLGILDPEGKEYVKSLMLVVIQEGTPKKKRGRKPGTGKRSRFTLPKMNTADPKDFIAHSQGGTVDGGYIIPPQMIVALQAPEKEKNPAAPPTVLPSVKTVLAD